MSQPIWNDDALLSRFWSKVDQKGEEECWPWLGGNVRGRGQFFVHGKWMLAPRIALVIAGRSWPEAKRFACHKCDNPNCVNPSHLWWGTASDNVQDALAKGRYPKKRRPRVKTRLACKRGHSLTHAGAIAPDGSCKICRHASKMRWQRANRSMRLSAKHASASDAQSSPGQFTGLIERLRLCAEGKLCPSVAEEAIEFLTSQAQELESRRKAVIMLERQREEANAYGDEEHARAQSLQSDKDRLKKELEGYREAFELKGRLLDQSQARCTELEKAQEPFAKYAAYMNADMQDDEPVLTYWPGPKQWFHVTAADFRRLRALTHHSKGD